MNSLVGMMVLLGARSLAGADDKETVSAAAVKVGELASYSFKGEMKLDLPINPGGGQQIPSFEGRFQKDVGLLITLGERGELFRKGDKNFIKTGQADWTELEKAQLGAPGGATQNRPRGGLMVMGRMMVKNFKAPHEEVRDLAKSFKELRKEEKTEKVGEKECSVYAGDLSEEGVKASALGKMIGQFGALGGGGQNAEMSGKGRIWIGPDGGLVRYELNTKVSVEFQGNPIEFSMARSTEFSAVGKTRVEIPEAVQKLLERPAQKPEEQKNP
jgi:hypothetical protein